jgi:hypothetical protein
VREITMEISQLARLMRGVVGALILIGSLGVVVPAARANVILTFDQTFTGPAENPAGTAYATLTVSQYNSNPNEILITETLSDTTKFRFNQGNSNHIMLAFNLPSLTLTGFTANNTTFTAGKITMLSPSTPSGVTFLTNVGPAGYPNFGYGIGCGSLCGAGFNGGFSGPLQFVITSASAILPTAMGVPSVQSNINYYASSDLVNSSGTTGNIGATHKAPEPSEIAFIWAGLMVPLLWSRHSRRVF